MLCGGNMVEIKEEDKLDYKRLNVLRDKGILSAVESLRDDAKLIAEELDIDIKDAILSLILFHINDMHGIAIKSLPKKDKT